VHKSVHSTLILFEQLSLTDVVREICENKSILSGSSESKEFDWDLFLEQTFLIVGVHHILHAVEKSVVVLFVLACLLSYLRQELLHGNDWDSKINRKST
jgi:hypothetical protein